MGKNLSVLFISCLLAACASVADSEQFYRPVTLQKFDPKPKGYKAPILAGRPKEKYDVIGIMNFSSRYTYKFMIECLEHNARESGADAVILTSSNSSTSQESYHVSGYTTTHPITTYSQGSAYGHANYYGSNGYYGTANATAYGSSTSTTYVPVYHEGYTGVRNVTTTRMEALFIRFK